MRWSLQTSDDWLSMPGQAACPHAIEARSLRIVGGLACHDFWVLRDADGRALAELHGLATDRNTGRVVPIGTDARRHSLRVWHFLHESTLADVFDVDPTSAPAHSFIRSRQPHRIVLKDAAQAVLSRWAKAVMSVEALNALDLDYPTYGFRLFRPTINSNSAHRTLGALMDVEIPRLSRALRPGSRQSMPAPAR